MADNFTFIISTGRTGTQFLGDLMSRAIEDCHSEHEPDVFHGFDAVSFQRLREFGLWHMLIGRALGQSGVRVLGTRYLNGQISLDRATGKLRDQRARFHASVPQGLLIESYGSWWMFARELGDIFPGSKSIGLIREPHAWIESVRSHLAGFHGRPGGVLAHRLPPGPLTAESVGDARWADKWDKLSQIGQLAWQWSYAYSVMDDAVQMGNMTMYRFEEVFDPKTDALSRLCNDASSFPDKSYTVGSTEGLLSNRRNASSAQKDAWQNWSDDDLALVEEMCAPLMARYGYQSVRS
ncbi:hypothetical protein ACI5KX_11840 [Erythrobacter sp. GH1-10]|uniref:hypothetical protein n=1 Tax=Erythrobacter sp. GH1-10 TaxID=3349334 RepID=UPI0038779CCD